MSRRLTGEAGRSQRRSVAATVVVMVGLLAGACAVTETTSWQATSGRAPMVEDSSGAPPVSRSSLDQPTIDPLARTPRFGPPPPPVHVMLASAGPGMVPWIHSVPTTQRVVFITVDDGYVKDPAAIAVVKAANIRLTAFLTVYAVNDQTPYYRGLARLGSRIESHAITHKQLEGQPYEYQREQICGSADWLALTFGQRPALFRPPYGLVDDTTLTIAQECGYRAGVHWSVAADDEFHGRPDDPRLGPGDILLLHWRANLAESLVEVLIAIKKAGLTPALLEEYV